LLLPILRGVAALNKLALETAAFDVDKELARQTKKQKTQEKTEIIPA
jgi:hypothetical protein